MLSVNKLTKKSIVRDPILLNLERFYTYEYMNFLKSAEWFSSCENETQPIGMFENRRRLKEFLKFINFRIIWKMKCTQWGIIKQNVLKQSVFARRVARIRESWLANMVVRPKLLEHLSKVKKGVCCEVLQINRMIAY